jgi:RimJ/RimL family protein N-acetyltransferase
MTASATTRYLRRLARVVRIRKKLLLSADVDGGTIAGARIPVEFRFGDAGDLAGLDPIEYAYDEEAKAFGRERLAAGDRLILGIANDHVVFYGWIMFQQFDLGVRNYGVLPVDAAYTYKLYTAPSVRGQGICRAYYIFLKKWLAGLGYHRVVCWVSSRNVASIRTHYNSGFSSAGTIWQLDLAGRSVFFLNRRARQFGFALRDSAFSTAAANTPLQNK